MGKIIVAILATCGALLILWLAIGPAIADTAFHISGRVVPWYMVVGGVFAFATWRIVKGK